MHSKVRSGGVSININDSPRVFRLSTSLIISCIRPLPASAGCGPNLFAIDHRVGKGAWEEMRPKHREAHTAHQALKIGSS
jgi:hypothetical protein